MNQKVLLANGCSMCYGSELFDAPDKKICLDNDARFKASWPGVLGLSLQCNKIVNLGYPSGSNDRIIRTTVEWIVDNWLKEKYASEDLFVIIGWSGPMRREFYIDEQWRQLIPYHDYKDNSASLFNRIYREIAWTEYESAIRFATQIMLLQQFLESYKISYLFFDAITSFSKTNVDSGNAIESYKSHINKKHYFNFDITDVDMATQLKCRTKSVKGSSHPDKDQHALWANILLEFVKKEQLWSNLAMIGKTSPVFEGTSSTEVLDIKIGLSPTPAINNLNFNRQDEKKEHLYSDKKIAKKSIWTRVKKSCKKDPFIYD